MAKKSLWQRISGFFRGGGSSGGSASDRIRRSVGTGSYGGYSSSYRSYGKSYKEDEEKKRRKKLEEKNKEVTAKLAEIAEVSKRADSLSSGKKATPPAPKEEKGSGVEKALKKISEKAKAPDPREANDPKHQALLESKKRGDEYRANLKKQKKEFNERTDYKYDVKHWKDKGDKEKVKQAQQLIKGGVNSNNAVADELAIKYHPIAYSAARGALSGTTFGLSEVALRNQKGEGAEREKYYQENKSRGAELAGELVGSALSFGGVGKAVEAPAAKIVGSELGEKAVGKLATSRLTRATAKRAIRKAGGELSDDLLKAVARRKAEDVAKGLTTSALIDASAGNVMNATMASRENEFGTKEWWKEFGKYAAINAGISGGVSMLPVAFGGKGIAREEIAKLAQELGITEEAAARRLLRGRLTVKGKANPLVRNADEAAEAVAMNADEVAENVARQNADEIAENVARGETPKAVVPEATENVAAEGVKPATETRSTLGLVDDLEAVDERYNELDYLIKHSSGDERKAYYGERRGLYNDFFEGKKLTKAQRAELESELQAVRQRLDDLPDNAYIEREELGNRAERIDRILKNFGEADEAIETAAKGVKPAEAAERDIHKILRDKNVALAEKEAALDARVEELNQAIDDAYRRANDPALSAGEREAANREYDEIVEELGRLNEEFNAAKPSSELEALMEERRNLRQTLDEMPFVEENYEERQAIMQRLKELDEQLPSDVSGSELLADELHFDKSGDMTPEDMTRKIQSEWERGRPSADTPRSGREAQNVVNKDIQEAADKAGVEWTSGKDYEGYSVREADEIWGTERVDGEIRTKRGGYTLATGMGDVHFSGDMKDAIASGDFNRQVRHNKEEYGKAVNRMVKYLEGNGGKEGNEGITELISRFNSFAKSNKPLTSNELRDQLYDILAAVDLANGNKDKEWASELFMAATRAGAEQSSVGGLTLYQWHRIAMSSPEHRAKVVREQVENMLNSSRKFRKQYLGSVKKKLKDAYSAVDDELPLDKFIEENPEATKGLKEAFERLEKATSKDEVEAAASQILIETRKIMPVTAFDQLTQWRYVAMLSSPKTHIKNIVGNLYGGTLGQISTAMASPLESRLAKELNLTTVKDVDLSKGVSADQELYLKSASGLSNKARTNAKKGVFEGIALRDLENKLKNAKSKFISAEGAEKEALAKEVEELTAKVAAAQKKFDAKKIRPEDDLLGSKAQELFHSKSADELLMDATKWEKQTYGAVSSGLDKASKVIGGALETSDAVAVERIYRETAEKILKANDYERFVKLAEGEGKEAAAAKAICERIEEYAAEHAAYRAATDTYRNYNAVATWMNKVVKNWLYNADANIFKKAAGFGLHAVMPFTKVPTNIMKRSIDYSPFGLIEGKKMLNEAIASGNYAEINKAVERLCEGTIGTGIAALGMGLGMIDPDGMTITTRLDRDDDRDKAKKDRGYMDYSVKIGNRDYTLEWATPTASSFFTGVETGRLFNRIYEAFADKNGLEFDPSKAFEASGEILTRLIEPTLQLGMFQGVNGVLEDSMEQRYDEANINPIFKAVGAITKNYVSSMTPSVLRSLSKAFAKHDYYISGENNLDYQKNALISKIPGLSAKKLDAKTNAWGEIKNERTDPKERLVRGAETLLAPWNSSEITWDDTDDQLYDLVDEYKKSHPGATTVDFTPKVFYDYNNEGLSIGKNSDNSIHIDLSNNDAAQYNIARGKAGEDAMAAALESVIFNRWYKDEKGHYTISDPNNYTPEMKAKKIAEFKDKGMKDVVAWVMEQPAFKEATLAEQTQIIREVIGNSSKETSIGAKRTSELTVAKRHDISEAEYNYKNEVPANAQKALDSVIASGLLSYEDAVDFARNAGKTYYRTDQKGEEGGSVQTYYNKKEMMAYLASKGYSYEEAEALYNAFKSSNAKDFNGIDTSSGRGGRRYYGGYRHYGHGGGRSGKAKVPAPKKIAKGSLKSGQALVTKTRTSSGKSTTPTLARVEAKIDLPTAKTQTRRG